MSNEGIKKVFQTKLTDVADLDIEGIGVIRFEGAKIYKWVQYNVGAGSVAAVVDNMTYYHTITSYVTDSAAVVSSDISDSLNIGAGSLMSAPTNLQFCWILIKGVVTLATTLTAGGDGNGLTAVGAADGTLDIGGLVTDFICATAIDASADLVLLNCPF